MDLTRGHGHPGPCGLLSLYPHVGDRHVFLLFLEAGRPKIRVPADSLSGGGLLPNLPAVSSQGGGGYKFPHITAQPPHTLPWGVGVPAYECRGGCKHSGRSPHPHFLSHSLSSVSPPSATPGSLYGSQPAAAGKPGGQDSGKCPASRRCHSLIHSFS